MIKVIALYTKYRKKLQYILTTIFIIWAIIIIPLSLIWKTKIETQQDSIERAIINILFAIGIIMLLFVMSCLGIDEYNDLKKEKHNGNI